MFVKVTSVAGKHYAKFVESYRENGKVKHRVIMNLGAIENYPQSALLSLVNAIQKYSLKSTLPVTSGEGSIDVNSLSGGKTTCYGYLPYKAVWKKLHLDEIIPGCILKKHNIGYDVAQAVFSMVVNRLLTPSSKLRHYNTKGHFTMLESHEENELHDYYRTLEHLAESKEEIEERLFEVRKDLFNQNLDVVFYDVTTYHFESQRRSELLDYGFSKANKLNEVQVVMGLLIDSRGIPVSYELFRGNTFDSKTLPEILTSLKERFSIKRIVIVGDKGINSKENLLRIKQAGFDYIVAGRLKNMPGKLITGILQREGYQSYSDGQEKFDYKVMSYENTFNTTTGKVTLEENLVCTYSGSRANNDFTVRNRALGKAEKVISSGIAPSVMKRKSGYKRFITGGTENPGTDGKYELDGRRAERESAFDGYYVIQTSDKSLSALDVVSQYGYLYKIEESFRLLKTTMKTRPVFHYNPERIKGHFVMCFIALLVERTLEYILKDKGVGFTTQKIKDALNGSLLAEIRVKDAGNFYVRMEQPKLTSDIFNALRIKHLRNVSSPEEIKEHFA